MLTYQILKQQVLRESLPPVDIRKLILEKELTKNHLKVGDSVQFKKPRRNPINGIIVDILSKGCKWGPGSTPLNVLVRVEKADRKTRIQYGMEIIHTNMKKLIARVI